MNSKNLKSWKPGESGNPKGRPVGSISLVSKLKKRIREHPEQVDDILDALFTAAKNGSSKHLEIILDRTEGKVTNEVQVEQTIQIQIQRLGAILPQALLQAGISKATAGEVIGNMERLLEA